jgi:hypothetical protein
MGTTHMCPFLPVVNSRLGVDPSTHLLFEPPDCGVTNVTHS